MSTVAPAVMPTLEASLTGGGALGAAAHRGRALHCGEGRSGPESRLGGGV